MSEDKNIHSDAVASKLIACEYLNSVHGWLPARFLRRGQKWVIVLIHIKENEWIEVRRFAHEVRIDGKPLQHITRHEFTNSKKPFKANAV